MTGRPPVRTLCQSQGMAMSKVDNDFLSPLDAAFSHKYPIVEAEHGEHFANTVLT
jgi:hypothetical protein